MVSKIKSVFKVIVKFIALLVMIVMAAVLAAIAFVPDLRSEWIDKLKSGVETLRNN